jgi:hypothetical protein
VWWARIPPDLELSHVSKIEAIYETMKGVAHDYLDEVCPADYKEKANDKGALSPHASKGTLV